MTVREKLRGMLVEHGLWEEQAESVLDSLKDTKGAESLVEVFEKDAAAYPYPGPFWGVSWMWCRRAMSDGGYTGSILSAQIGEMARGLSGQLGRIEKKLDGHGLGLAAVREALPEDDRADVERTVNQMLDSWEEEADDRLIGERERLQGMMRYYLELAAECSHRLKGGS